ncbi:hypothetical protein CQA49_09620 [Helicobacter sp. MIT 00-7814]|uniref:hypothetical protein n=1 Tax=unclassified Helicobacter TaxID=2593540 RepID=UPI000E1E3AD5|nr:MULTISPECIES: hypothetical protein [unclassified Helicobacter]RDU51323.1 hypothetical protein CQA37_09785 [Helicobacter sp. MIT 99-10781]RDU51422.1 hypothetical protein CQA49_09620 [Helicobacter sp. MIT 00-7814]
MEYRTISLCDILSSNQAHSQTPSFLEDFSCSKNKDLEHFIRNKAIEFEKAHRSRTFLILKSNKLEAFFTLSLNVLKTQGLSKSRIQKLSPRNNKKDTDIPCILIGQFGKCDGASIDGDLIMQTMLAILLDIRKYIGGKFVLLDSVNVEKVLDFYERHGFKRISFEKESEEVKMIRYFSRDL